MIEQTPTHLKLGGVAWWVVTGGGGGNRVLFESAIFLKTNNNIGR